MILTETKAKDDSRRRVFPRCVDGHGWFDTRDSR